MLVQRIFPPESKFFKNNKNNFSKIGDLFDSLQLIQLFSIWTLTISGLVLGSGQTDRYIYLDWTNWISVFIKLSVVTILFLFILRSKSLWNVGLRPLSKNEIPLHVFIALCLILFGWMNTSNNFPDIIHIIAYIFAFLGCLFGFQLNLEFDKDKKEWFNSKWDDKELYFSLAFVSLLIALIIGFKYDDPFISTASAVAIPFSIIALIWPNHIRHLQRLRFYPIFIFAMFLCVRVPWFIIPLIILFIAIRIINYFRYGIVYPSFGVDFDEDISTSIR